MYEDILMQDGNLMEQNISFLRHNCVITRRLLLLQSEC